ncbi:hypothetical protein PHYBOEH_010541 [Phytophthora boehmeriae]|uniref:Bzip transcription factor n=1 Tax=Phytophthora boehmeriae TaxID=109152 RepID=A0A8T1VMD9_9STRA|nr:hypothetical protein PHYBOEH_010541 [Phytophthora boehmeriae]
MSSKFNGDVIAPVLLRHRVRGFNCNTSANLLRTSQCAAATLSKPTTSSKLTRQTSDSDGVTSKKRALRMLSDWLASGSCTKEEQAVLVAIKKQARREQLRIGQARYREKHRKRGLQIEQNVQRLREEIQVLKLKRNNTRREGRRTPSPWNIISGVLHLIEASFQSPTCVASADEMKKSTDIRRNLRFLKAVLAPDVAMGELQGFDALLEQVRCYSQYFGEPKLELVQIEGVVSGITRATATMSITITELTLERVFPHLCNALRTRLAGQRLSCSCAMTFLFNEDSQLVERLEISIDLLQSLAQTLGGCEGGIGRVQRGYRFVGMHTGE